MYSLSIHPCLVFKNSLLKDNQEQRHAFIEERGVYSEKDSSISGNVSDVNEESSVKPEVSEAGESKQQQTEEEEGVSE